MPYRSILDRDGKRPIIIHDETSSGWILTLLTLTVVIVFVSYFLIIIRRDNFNTKGKVLGGRKGQNDHYCPVGKCATNLLTGTKRCPIEDDGHVLYDTEKEVCNSKYLCENKLTPYAKMSDESTSSDGVCQCILYNKDGTCAKRSICPCLRKAQCPNYVLTTFSAYNGSVYSDIAKQDMTFPQSDISHDGSGQFPLVYKEGSTFCLAPPEWLPLATPGCNFVKYGSMTYDQIVTCMSLPNPDSEIKDSNPCLRGTLAFVSDNPSFMTKESALTTLMGCVKGEPCPTGKVAIFDTQSHTISCKVLE